jgi:hypothetical protein
MPKMYFIYKVAGKNPWQIKTRPIYGMETNIKSGNGWF